VASAEILVGDDTLSPEQREEVRSIRRSADRAAALTRQLLAFGRRQRLLPRVIDVNEALRDMEDFIRSLVGGDVKLVMDLAPDAGRARVDPGQLEHVMMNLVVNAREAMPAGGTLVIATANVGFTEATQRMHPDVRPGPYVMVSVADTGVGIAAEHQEKIFEPFFTTKPTGEGVGLGLSTAYGILKQSGGHLWVESSAGRGSTFKVFLPRVTLAADPRHDYPRPVTEGAGETVLVVEDEDAVRRVAARVLRSRGYRVVTAANAEEAMQVAAAHDGPIDLLLSDVVMPGMSGTVLAERLVAERPGLKVLFMSGYTAEEIGSDVPLLSKPFTPDELLSEVRIALEGQGARE
ncbi:MAG TPA: ATP-binding protein, partial [Gemmatimonadales bacterium]|nr:ATP-binding protein [Gemmatimonadales bacterium]